MKKKLLISCQNIQNYHPTKMDLVCNRITLLLSVIASIGLSDAIEYYISPLVHKMHNCPQIMRMNYQNYNGYYAFISGVKCSWFLILPLCLFKHSIAIIAILDVINILIPIACHLFGIDKHDIYYAHKMLYLINPILLIASVIIGFFSNK